MIKAIMLSHYYYPHIGGNEGQCRLLTKALLQIGLQISVVTKRYQRGLPAFEFNDGTRIYRIFCLSSLFKTPVTDLIHSRFGKVKLLNYMGKVLAWTFFFADEFVFVLLAVLKLVSLKKDTDIIHAHQIHWIAFCGTMTSKITRKPLLVKDATLSGFRELKMMPCSRAMKRSIIKTACFAAVSADIKVSLLHEGVNTNRIFLTPNGVLLPSHTNRYLETGFDILFVGNFIQGRIKGLDILLHSFAMVLAKYPQSRLFILGEGDPTAYARILTEHDIPPYCCEFLGKRDVAHYYMNCTVFVLPSRSEGMSNALLEAMGHGMACISTDVSGSKDIITNGQNGMLVERENIAQLADALLFLFSNKELAFQMGRKARDTVIEHYQIDKIAQNYAGIYKQILEEYND